MSLVYDFPFALPRSGVDATSFMDAMARLPAPVSVITSIRSDGRPVGATLSAVSSLSLDPPLFLACFAHRSETLSALRRHKRYLVHILAAGQDGVARAFASKSPDKFNSLEWAYTEEGLPLLSGCSVVLRCRLFNVMPGGDHAVVAGEVEHVERTSGAVPMIYVNRQMTRPEGTTN
jgi:flavin reductase (DIM6/NTAB) family NADH-FMN oxidoreductase RutF